MKVIEIRLIIVEIDCKISLDSLPKHLKYWYDAEPSNQSKLYDQESSLCCSIRKLEFDLFLTDLEVHKWESQLISMEQNLKEIE